MAEAALSVEGLEVRYGAVTAVRDVSFEVARGEIVGLIGPNGAGKSTTLHAIMGLVPARSGSVAVSGAQMLGRSPEAIAKAGVGLVPEGRRIYADFTVEENLRLGLAARRGGRGARSLSGAYELFPVLREFRRRPAGLLSGGQQQQLAIARALVAQPDVLLLDEPSLGLAPSLVDDVFAALANIRDGGFAVLLVEQRAQRTVALAERTHVLANGELRLTLGPADADNTEKMVAAYLAG
jgi:branched-chain amino acid transport system ATP-binding protein